MSTQHLDETEDITVHLLTEEEVKELLVKDEIQGKTTLYTGIDKVRFKNPVKPGDLCEVTASLKDRRGAIFYCEATLKVNGNLCSKGQLSFALV